MRKDENGVSYKVLYKDIEKAMCFYKTQIYNQWTDIALGIFEWVNLPENMTSWHIEKTLYEKGFGCFFKDNERGFLFLPASQKGAGNVYGEAVAWTISGNAYSTQRALKDCVQINCRPTKTPTSQYVDMITQELTEIQFAKRQNRSAQACPVILSGKDSDILSLKNIFAQLSGFVPAIFTDKNLNINESVKAVNLNIPFNGKAFYEDYVNTEQRLLAYLGLNFNPLADKRERLITDEANANAEQVNANLNSMLSERKRAVEKIRKTFPELSTLDVRLNPDILPDEEETAEIDTLEGAKNDEEEN